jgi:predicted transposase YbfD/YdcC
MLLQARPLIEVFAQIPDPRKARGKRHSLAAVLALATTARLRGSRAQGAEDTHLLSALSHRLGLTAHQRAVAGKTNEIGAVADLLRALMLEGRVFTMDPLLTQRTVASQIVAGTGDYVMVVKANQPALLDDIRVVFERPHGLLGPQSRATTTDIGHSRIERRSIRTSAVMAGYSDWPGLEQVYRIERTRENKKTGEREHEMIYGVTSLRSEQADLR